MQYCTLKANLAGLGCTVVDSEHEYEAARKATVPTGHHRKTSKLQTTFKYTCTHGKTQETTVSSFKGRSAYYRSKNSTSWTCSCIVQPEVTSDETTALEASLPGGQRPPATPESRGAKGSCLRRGPGACGSCQPLVVDELPETELLETGTPVEESTKETILDNTRQSVTEALSSESFAFGKPSASEVYRDADQEWYGWYISRRTAELPLGCARTTTANTFNPKGKIEKGSHVDHENDYINVALRWVQTTPNILTKKLVNQQDLKISPCGTVLYIMTIGFSVVVQTAHFHNILVSRNPRKVSAHYTKHSPCAVLIVDDGEIIDVWYFIKGKKPYSLAHKHDFDPHAKIVAKCPRTEPEYFYFERAMLALDSPPT
jgi:hypothetical protein